MLLNLCQLLLKFLWVKLCLAKRSVSHLLCKVFTKASENIVKWLECCVQHGFLHSPVSIISYMFSFKVLWDKHLHFSI